MHFNFKPPSNLAGFEPMTIIGQTTQYASTTSFDKKVFFDKGDVHRFFSLRLPQPAKGRSEPSFFLQYTTQEKHGGNELIEKKKCFEKMQFGNEGPLRKTCRLFQSLHNYLGRKVYMYICAAS
jgi:hypothetical protein